MLAYVPNASLFPEIDFTSKCVESTPDSNEISKLLSPLSDADSGTLRRRLSGKKFYVHDIGLGQVAVGLTRSKRLEQDDEET